MCRPRRRPAPIGLLACRRRASCAVHARELGVLVDGEGAACVGVPAGATRGRLGGRARDVDGYCSDGFYLHVFLS